MSLSKIMSGTNNFLSNAESTTERIAKTEKLVIFITLL